MVENPPANAEDTSLIFALRKSHMRRGNSPRVTTPEPELGSLQVAAAEPVCYSTPWSLCSVTEKSLQWKVLKLLENSSPSLQLEKALMQQWRSSHK